MAEIETHWTKKEFLAYLLLYVALSDYIESPEEKEMVLSKVGKIKYEKIHKELDEDNDYQSLQKILNHVKSNNYSKAEIDQLMEEVKSLFLSDGDYNTLESNMLLGISRLLH